MGFLQQGSSHFPTSIGHALAKFWDCVKFHPVRRKNSQGVSDFHVHRRVHALHMKQDDNRFLSGTAAQAAEFSMNSRFRKCAGDYLKFWRIRHTGTNGYCGVTSKARLCQCAGFSQLFQESLSQSGTARSREFVRLNQTCAAVPDGKAQLLSSAGNTNTQKGEAP